MSLNGAARAGLERASHEARAVMLGDLPALTAADLDDALARATGQERAVVPDAEGSGSVLVTWRVSGAHEAHFGTDSAAKHADAGHTVLDVPASSTLRRDVDTAEQLEVAAALGLGPRTTALLEAARAA